MALELPSKVDFRLPCEFIIVYPENTCLKEQATCHRQNALGSIKASQQCAQRFAGRNQVPHPPCKKLQHGATATTEACL